MLLLGRGAAVLLIALAATLVPVPGGAAFEAYLGDGGGDGMAGSEASDRAGGGGARGAGPAGASRDQQVYEWNPVDKYWEAISAERVPFLMGLEAEVSRQRLALQQGAFRESAPDPWLLPGYAWTAAHEGQRQCRSETAHRWCPPAMQKNPPRSAAPHVEERWYSTASLHGVSVFLLMGRGRQSVVAERFFNGQQWVFVRHATTHELESILSFNGRLFAVGSRGEMLERVPASTRTLTWACTEGFRLLGPGIGLSRRDAVSRQGSLYFLDEDRRVLERTEDGDWIKYQSIYVAEGVAEAGSEAGSEEGATKGPESGSDSDSDSDSDSAAGKGPADADGAAAERPAHIADVGTLAANLFVFVGEHGSLLGGIVDFNLLTVFVRPMAIPARIRPAQAVSLRSSVFVSTAAGALAELVIARRAESAGGFYKLIPHDLDLPARGLGADPAPRRLAGGPSPGVRAMSIFVVTTRGVLAERVLEGNGGNGGDGGDGGDGEEERWVWVFHSKPPDPRGGPDLLLAPVRAQPAGNLSAVFVAVDGRLVERHLRREGGGGDGGDGGGAAALRWGWRVFDVPEDGHGRAKYCSADPAAPDSCMPHPPEPPTAAIL